MYAMFLFVVCALFPYIGSADWMLDQIQEDLAPFKEQQISKASLQEFFQHASHDNLLVYVRIYKGKACSYSPGVIVNQGLQSRLDSVHQFFTELTKNYQIPDIHFIVALHDAESSFSSIPIFTFAKPKGSSAILIPDFEALTDNDKLIDMCEAASLKYPWRTKKEIVFWRGATTGGNFEIHNFLQFPRGLLVFLSTVYPKWLDAAFHAYVQATPDVYDFIETQIKPRSQSVPIPDHFQYKYLIDVDGNTSTYSRCRWILLSNCVLIKTDSDNVQWYYKAIKPWIHYIPVDADFQNLPDVYQWLKSHDEGALQIAEEGRTLGQTIFSKRELERYVVTLLNEYAKIITP